MVKKIHTLKNLAFVNWKTTVGGIVAGLAIIFDQLRFLFDGDASTLPDYNIIVAALSGIWFAIVARDADKSTEQSTR